MSGPVPMDVGMAGEVGTEDWEEEEWNVDAVSGQSQCHKCGGHDTGISPGNALPKEKEKEKRTMQKASQRGKERTKDKAREQAISSAGPVRNQATGQRAALRTEAWAMRRKERRQRRAILRRPPWMQVEYSG